MPSHPLDRPVWGALTAQWSAFALGDAGARRLPPEYGPFAASADGSPASLAELGRLLPQEGHVWLVEADEETPLPPGAVVRQRAKVCQMVATALKAAPAALAQIVSLTEDDAPQMRALAALTEPGPFFERTHRLGEFIGVKPEGVLVAMAGERMRLARFAEISGVCTHPDHRGRGHAGALTLAVAHRIAARGETPFLHVYPTNTGAIALYEALGFTLRRVMTMTVLARA